MSSRQRTRRLHSNKQELSSDLARHYRGIGIKAVVAATRKSPQRTGSSTTVAKSKRDQARQGKTYKGE
jgi:hypothetical protein